MDGCECNLAETSVTPLIARVDSAVIGSNLQPSGTPFSFRSGSRATQRPNNHHPFSLASDSAINNKQQDEQCKNNNYTEFIKCFHL